MLWQPSHTLNAFQICSILLYFLLFSSLLFYLRLSHEHRINHPVEPQTPDCAPIHVFAARGSGEPVGPGAMGYLATLIQIDHPGTTSEAIDYPALLDPNDPTKYAFSTHVGVSAIMWQVTSYYNRCPDSKMVLLGYSQVLALPIAMGSLVDASNNKGCTYHWRCPLRWRWLGALPRPECSGAFKLPHESDSWFSRFVSIHEIPCSGWIGFL